MMPETVTIDESIIIEKSTRRQRISSCTIWRQDSGASDFWCCSQKFSSVHFRVHKRYISYTELCLFLQSPLEGTISSLLPTTTKWIVRANNLQLIFINHLRKKPYLFLRERTRKRWLNDNLTLCSHPPRVLACCFSILMMLYTKNIF